MPLSQVYKTVGTQLLLMKVVGAFMFLVAVAATIASCQNIIVSWVSRAAAHLPGPRVGPAWHGRPCHCAPLLRSRLQSTYTFFS